jgi:hypothetical protein
MTILNNVDHGDLRYLPLYGPDFGDAVNRMELLLGEFAEAQRHHPIVFAPDHDGRLTAMVLLGFEKGENLHFDGSDWGTAYVPATRRRGPFSLSVKTDASGQEIDMLIEVDLDDPRVGSENGAALFKSHGGNSAALDAISEALVTLYDGMKATPDFISCLQELGLLRSVEMEIDLGNGQTFTIPGHFVVDEARFAALNGDTLKTLRDRGYLMPLVHAMSSIANIQGLVDRKLVRTSGLSI